MRGTHSRHGSTRECAQPETTMKPARWGISGRMKQSGSSCGHSLVTSKTHCGILLHLKPLSLPRRLPSAAMRLPSVPPQDVRYPRRRQRGPTD